MQGTTLLDALKPLIGAPQQPVVFRTGSGDEAVGGPMQGNKQLELFETGTGAAAKEEHVLVRAPPPILDVCAIRCMCVWRADVYIVHKVPSF